MDKMRQWSLLTALTVVGVMAAGWFLLVSPQRSHAKEIQAQATSQQSATASLQTQVQQLKQQQKNAPAQQRSLMRIATQIPDNPQLPALIRELSAAASDAGVSLRSLAPAQPSLVASAPAATTTTTGAPATVAPLAQIPITIQVTGSYFNVESFFRSVEHLDRAMMVTGFTISPSDSSSSNTTTGATSGGSAVGAAPNALAAQIQAVVFESPSVAPAQAATPSVAGTQPAPAQSAAPTTSTTTPAPAAGSAQ